MVNDTIAALEGFKKELQGFRQKAEDVKLQRVRNETNLEHLKKSEGDIVAKIVGRGYDPDNLKSHIEDKMGELSAFTSKLRSVMPDENGVVPANAAEILGIVKKIPEVKLVESKDLVEPVAEYDDLSDIPL